MLADNLKGYVTKRLVIWSFSGAKLGDFVHGITTINLPPSLPGSSIIDYDVKLTTGNGYMDN